MKPAALWRPADKTALAERLKELRALAVDRIMGANLRRLREAKGIAPADLAQVLNLTPETLVAVEAGNVRLYVGELERAVAALEIAIDDLFADAPVPVPA